MPPAQDAIPTPLALRCEWPLLATFGKGRLPLRLPATHLSHCPLPYLGAQARAPNSYGRPVTLRTSLLRHCRGAREAPKQPTRRMQRAAEAETADAARGQGVNMRNYTS